MTLEIDAAADLLTAGMIAKEIEGQGPGAAAHHACANCATPVHGKFCSNCGQSAHLHRSILHLGEELLHGLLHFDAKGWRTLPMLVFKPGQLTRRYVDGQRTRFVSPLALFLFMVFVMFFVFSTTAGNGHVAGVADDASGIEKARAKIALKVAERQAEVAKAEQALAAAKGEDVADARRDLEDAREALRGVEKARDVVGDKDTINITSDGKKIKTGIAVFDSAIKHAIDNPELTKYKLKNAASKYSFLLVPISMPFVWLMFFWKRRFTMYDHAVFVLYSLCFMALLMSVVVLLAHVGAGTIAAILVVCAPPLHMYKQLRGTYALSRYGALWRTAGLLLVSLIVIAIYSATIVVLSA
ncbi:MAG: DUF3667 domain-containing protein [Telluria sp.]